ncbi:hypothetical protein B7494_g3012 [Chlorociboria aeruginascens]|nr:hypothetical protein B7494_g3012 [Chlorociboria aeruginascens]
MAAAFPLFDGSHDGLLMASDDGKRYRRRKSSEKIRAGGSPLLSVSSSKLSNSHACQSSKQMNYSKHGKSHSLLRRCKRIAFKHTWIFPLVILLIFLLLYAINPTESNKICHFIFLSYRLDGRPGSGMPPHYGKGIRDIFVVSFYTVVLSFVREFLMQELLHPLARFYGIKSRGKQLRFTEQMYTAVYFAFSGSTGLYVMSRTPVWYFNTRGMYESFPHKTHEALFKFYYLLQAAYWVQQAIVLMLGMEKRRKDFQELVAHHVITLSLIALSYHFHFTYMGVAVYLIHDISDFFLATSKSLNYIASPLEGPAFGICICVWIYLRHYLNLSIILSLFTEFKTIGPYQLDWQTEQYKCLLSNVIALGLLVALQALNLFWLFCLFRNAYRFLVYKIAKDDRSEAEESEIERTDYKSTS